MVGTWMVRGKVPAAPPALAWSTPQSAWALDVDTAGTTAVQGQSMIRRKQCQLVYEWNPERLIDRFTHH